MLQPNELRQDTFNTINTLISVPQTPMYVNETATRDLPAAFLTTTRQSSYLLALRCSLELVTPSLLEKGKGCAPAQLRLLLVVALTRSSTNSYVASTGPLLFVGNVASALPPRLFAHAMPLPG